MTSNVAEWFWVWCHLNSISTVFEATFSYYSIMEFSRISVISEFSLLGIGLKTKTRKSWKISIFGSTKFKCIWIYFSISISNFWVLKLKQEKQRKTHLINLEGSDALKRQKYDTWIAMWLNHFENDVIWTAFQLFLKLRSHITVLWHFCRISVISKFSFLGIGLKTKTRKSWKTFIFGSIMFKCMWIYFSISISNFWVLKLK